MRASGVRDRRVWRARSGGDFFSTGVPSLLLAALIVPFLMLGMAPSAAASMAAPCSAWR